MADKFSDENIKNAVLRMLDLPEYSVTQGARIEISSNREAVVENCRSILEYTPETVRLLTPKMTVKFVGKELRIDNMNRSSATVRGKINSLEFFSLE